MGCLSSDCILLDCFFVLHIPEKNQRLLFLINDRSHIHRLVLRDSSNRGVFKEYYSLNLLTLKTSLENLIQTGDDFTVPGPDRPKPTYDTDWRQKPEKHYKPSTVDPSISALTYPPTIFLGRLFKMIWGALPIWEVRQSSIDVDLYLPDCLHPVPLPTLTDHIKHQTLCAKPIIWLVRRSQVQAYPIYRLSDKAELLKEIQIDHKYNFVILGDGRLVFARIPHVAPKYPYRLLTKHVALAKRSANVRFAGELRKDEDNQTLLVNNNSGTYRPDDELVLKAVAYFQQLFPHFLVRGIPRK